MYYSTSRFGVFLSAARNDGSLERMGIKLWHEPLFRSNQHVVILNQCKSCVRPAPKVEKRGFLWPQNLISAGMCNESRGWEAVSNWLQDSETFHVRRRDQFVCQRAPTGGTTGIETSPNLLLSLRSLKHQEIRTLL